MQVIFENEKDIETQKEMTILELALENKIPIAHACGGNAKCSTCRVLVLSGIENLTTPTEKEETIAKSKGFEKNIRLACQAKVKGNIKVKRLVLDKEDMEQAISQCGVSTGKEVHLTVLFSDIRGYTTFTENALSYDVIHILNRYFKKMGDIIVKNNGFIDKYIGDGLMALFGLQDSRAEQVSEYYAVKSGLEMLEAMKELNVYLKNNFNVEFEIGIGIHSGHAIVGNIGHPNKIQLTAIGDTVNLASRVESLNKENSTHLLITQPVYEKLKNHIVLGKEIQTQVKGKSGVYSLYEVLGLNIQRTLKETLQAFLYQKIAIEDAPSIIRLAFHDAFLIPKTESTLGLRARIFRNHILKLEVHQTLQEVSQKIIELYSEFKQNSGSISLADFLALSACIALEKLGGPHVECKLGREDSFDEVEPVFMHEKDNFLKLLSYFKRLGFNLKEMIALTGAHTVGKAHGKFFTHDPYSFNNSYFKYLLGLLKPKEDNILLESDLEQLSNQESYRLIQRYATDEEIFFEDFKKAFEKLLSFGHANLS